MIRAFLGIDLPPDMRAALQMQQFYLPMPRRVDPEDLHLTLVFLGDCSHPVLEAAHDGFEALREPAFSLTLQGFGLFGKARPHSAWAGIAPSDDLVRLQAKTETIARRAGCKIDARKFLPHVTLGRFATPAPPDILRLERSVALGAAFRAGPWEVKELTLWRSHLGGIMPSYECLARYPLGKFHPS